MRARTLVVGLCFLFLLPASARADAFSLYGENLDLDLSVSGNIITPDTSITVPLGQSVPINFTVLPSPGMDQSIFDEEIAERADYYELWRGVPFKGTATEIDRENITGSASGTFSGTFAPGDYFVVVFLSQDFEDPATCIARFPVDSILACFSYGVDTFSNFFLGSADDVGHAPAYFTGYHFTVTGPPQVSNVLFLPGIQTSRLYASNGSKLWEPINAANVDALAMNTDGSSKEKISVGDPIDYPFGLSAIGDLYGSFDAYMDGLVADKMLNAWRAYGYDWRQDVFDIVNNGTARTDGTTESLEQTVKDLAATSATGKVTIVAHSNGGLLAKALAITLAQKGESDLLDKIILVGTPELGTPSTIGALLNGDDESIGDGLIAGAGAVRAAAEYMPGAYGLLPSSAYFDQIGTPLAGNDSFSSFANFLTDGTRKVPAESDLVDPDTLSANILAKETATHAELDDWQPPAGVSVIQITGWGQNTISQLSYGTKNTRSCSFSFLKGASCNLKTVVTHTPTMTRAGDATVIAASAVASPAETWYFDLGNTNKNITHTNLLASSALENFLTDIFNGTESATTSFSTVAPALAQGSSDLAISVHSPVLLLATDAEGNQTGFVPVPGSDAYAEIDNIPGSSTSVIDDGKYIFLPQDSYQFSFSGTGTGPATFDIGHLAEDGSIATDQEFADVPVATSTTGAFSVANGATAALSVETNGATLTLPAPSSEQLADPADALETEIRNSSAKPFVKNRFLALLNDPATLQTAIESQLGRSLPYPEGELLLQLAAKLTQ